MIRWHQFLWARLVDNYFAAPSPVLGDEQLQVEEDTLILLQGVDLSIELVQGKFEASLH